MEQARITRTVGSPTRVVKVVHAQTVVRGGGGGTAGVSSFNNRTGAVTLTANDVYSASFDTGKTGTPQIYVRTSNIDIGKVHTTANAPNGTQRVSYSILANYANAPLYRNATISTNIQVLSQTTTATNANLAASDVGKFEVIFQTTANLPVFAGTTSRRTGLQVLHINGIPFINLLGGVTSDTYLNVNAVPDTYVLTKAQTKAYFLTKDQADLLYEPLKRINP